MPTHHCLFRRLSADTVSAVRDRVAGPRVTRWAADHEALAGCATPADIVARSLDTADRPGANRALGALLAVGSDDLFARRIALAALAPGLASVAHRHATRWGSDPAEADQAAAAVAWELTADPAITNSTWPAQTILDRVQGRLRWSHTRTARHAGEALPPADLLPDPTPDPFVVVDARLDVTTRLAAAVTGGDLTPLGAGVIWATRIDDLPVTEIGRQLHRSPGSVRVLRSRAETALRAAS